MPRQMGKVKNLPLNLSGTFVEGKDEEPRNTKSKFLSQGEEPVLTAKQEIPTLTDYSARWMSQDRNAEEAIESYIIRKTWN